MVGGMASNKRRGCGAFEPERGRLNGVDGKRGQRAWGSCREGASVEDGGAVDETPRGRRRRRRRTARVDEWQIRCGCERAPPMVARIAPSMPRRSLR